MYLTIKALVLRVSVYNDSDALLTLLTHEHGKITVKARGLRRKNSPLAASCQLLAYSEFTIFEYRGYYTINEAHSVELFHNLRKDLQKLSLGTYFVQVAEVLSQEDTPTPDLLSLALNSLYALTYLSLDENLVKAVFEFRCACYSGYAPDLNGCVHCGNSVPDRFNLSDGCLECSACRDASSSGIRMPVTPGALDALRYISICDKQKLFSFQLSKDTISCLSQIAESYLQTQLERGFSALDFYKSLFINNGV